MLSNLRIKLAKYLHKKLQEKIKNRKPDFVVGKDYLRRWWIIPRNAIFNIYYHNFKVSDDDRAMHDHMYINCSFLLDGDYFEHTKTTEQDRQVFHRQAGDLKLRLPWTLHRIEIPKGKECWTLFITLPRMRVWGFQVGPIVRNLLGFKTKSGWMDHESYIAQYGEQN